MYLLFWLCFKNYTVYTGHIRVPGYWYEANGGIIGVADCEIATYEPVTGDTIYSCLQCAPGFHLEYVNGPEYFRHICVNGPEYFRHICTKDEELFPSVIESPTPTKRPTPIESPTPVTINEKSGIDGWKIYTIVFPPFMVILIIVAIVLLVRYFKERRIETSSAEATEHEAPEENPPYFFPTLDESSEGEEVK